MDQSIDAPIAAGAARPDMISVPFGGYKQSGWGYEYGWKGIEGYLKMKSIFADISA